MQVKTFFIYILVSVSLLVAQEKPQLCFTFDDGNSKNILNYDFNEINNMLLKHLENHKLQSILYVSGEQMDNKNGDEVLKKWNDSGHFIANHTYSHWYYNSKKISIKDFTNDIYKCDSLLKKYSNYVKYYRAPYLKRGNSVEKRDGLIEYLNQNGYKNGYVTIDASDWYYNKLLIESLKKNDKENVEKIKKLYIEHIIDRAVYYDNLATEILGRKIKHSLLLHHNLISALYLEDLIEAFKNNGWDIIDADKAIKDKVYDKEMRTLPAGESIIWSMAKETGKYEKVLRYPAEDSKYEKKKFD